MHVPHPRPSDGNRTFCNRQQPKSDKNQRSYTSSRQHTLLWLCRRQSYSDPRRRVHGHYPARSEQQKSAHQVPASSQSHRRVHGRDVSTQISRSLRKESAVEHGTRRRCERCDTQVHRRTKVLHSIHQSAPSGPFLLQFGSPSFRQANNGHSICTREILARRSDVA